MRNRFMIYNIHAHFMMERKVLRFLRKSLNVNCFCLIITYFYVLIFQFLKKWTFRIQHISSLTKMNGLQHSSFFSGKSIINDIDLCFLKS